MEKKGRKRTISEESYLKAVSRVKSLDDAKVGSILGLNRSTVWRFSSNPENMIIIEKAKQWLEDLDSIRFDGKVGFDLFRQIPIIQNWTDLMMKAGTPITKQNSYVRGIYNLCLYSKVHPDKLDYIKCSDVVLEMKNKKKQGLEVPNGLSEISQRQAMRSFFQVAKGISGQILASYGIDARESEGSGSLSRQRVSKEQRRRYEDETLRQVCIEYCKNRKIDPERLYLQILNYTKFMYYSGTRRSAVSIIKLNDLGHKLQKDLWMIEIFDKGRKGKKKRWEKNFISFALDNFKSYISEMFNIPIDELENRRTEIGYIFPSIVKNEDLVCGIVKEALKRAGCITTIPLHIWRHTAAQDFLDATDGNYELTASVLGWVNTLILKKHYGEMSLTTKIRGLRKAMGLPVEDVTYQLRW